MTDSTTVIMSTSTTKSKVTSKLGRIPCNFDSINLGYEILNNYDTNCSCYNCGNNILSKSQVEHFIKYIRKNTDLKLLTTHAQRCMKYNYLTQYCYGLNFFGTLDINKQFDTLPCCIACGEYLLTSKQLQELCEQSKLSKTGTKKQLAKRIFTSNHILNNKEIPLVCKLNFISLKLENDRLTEELNNHKKQIKILNKWNIDTYSVYEQEYNQHSLARITSHEWKIAYLRGVYSLQQCKKLALPLIQCNNVTM